MFAYIPSMVNSGGICTIWMSSMFFGSVVLSESFALGVRFSSTQSDDTWTLLNVYGPCAGPNRVLFSNWFFDLEIPSREDWLILGDFNFIRAPDNHNKGGGETPQICCSSTTSFAFTPWWNCRSKAGHIPGVICSLIHYLNSLIGTLRLLTGL